MKYNWKTMTDEKKDMAIRDELTLSTHMGTTKDDFIEIMRYQSAKLSRTRIRETATEPPTEQKEYRQGALSMVMAFDRELGYWEKHTVRYINDDVLRCPYWFPLPGEPEVTP